MKKRRTLYEVRWHERGKPAQWRRFTYLAPARNWAKAMRLRGHFLISLWSVAKRDGRGRWLGFQRLKVGP